MKGDRYRGRGWHGESYRHYLAAKGVRTKPNRYFQRTALGRLVDKAFQAGEPVSQAQVNRSISQAKERSKVAESGQRARELTKEQKKEIKKRIRKAQEKTRGGRKVLSSFLTRNMLNNYIQDKVDTISNMETTQKREGLSPDELSDLQSEKELLAQAEALQDWLNEGGSPNATTSISVEGFSNVSPKSISTKIVKRSIA